MDENIALGPDMIVHGDETLEALGQRPARGNTSRSHGSTPVRSRLGAMRSNLEMDSCQSTNPDRSVGEKHPKLGTVQYSKRKGHQGDRAQPTKNGRMS
ncbi:hypothetical protein T265_05250 [Opisthorchis viverrini]|uniref:Uncharacterized protein n=1 Tax=Opisthorchis viverrini TaxID=6198 RepID=A0A074ZWP4_OPIVI|nr:hypothetical protein T265_05250 [Opisthorchis viverrini]KER27760.1 hypothetical protein T265_05250 [Opisthorchis viverrini]